MVRVVRDAHKENAAALIAKHVEPHPHREGRAEWRLRESGAPVWAVLGALVLAKNPADNPAVLSDQAVAKMLGEEEALRQVAQDYQVKREVIDAAITYYWHNKRFIDARLLLNAG